MAEGGREEAAATSDSSPEHLDEYHHLVELGLDARVAGKLEEIFTTGKLVHSELDDRALDALKEFPVDGALAVLQQFLESNLEHVSNKSAFLCGIMKTYRQKVRALGLGAVTAATVTTGTAGASADPAFDLKPVGKGPDEEKIREILKRSGYTLDVTTGQRKYGGPPPNWQDPPPPNGCEVFCGKIPRDVYEDELIPLFEKCGTIWDLRLMMDPLTGLNRGYAFVTFTTTEAAHEAVRQLNNMEMKGGRHLKVNVSVPNLRLFVGNIPKSKGKAEIMEEFSKVTAGLSEVIIYSSPDDRRKNRGFCFLEYDSHKSASLAKRRLSTGRVKIFGCDIIVDWADPQEEPDQDVMSKVKVLYVRNLTQEITEEKLKESFEVHGPIQRVKKIKDYAFIHFEERDDAVKAMDELNGHVLLGSNPIEVSLAKPPSDRKKKEEILKARERRMLQSQGTLPRGGLLPVAVPFAAHRGSRGPNIRGPAAAAAAAAAPSLPYGRDYDYEYSYGPYGRGGYADPYYNGSGYYPYAGGDYYYDYPVRGGRGGRPAASISRGGRGRGAGRGSERAEGSPSAGAGGARWRGGSDPGSFHSRGGGRGAASGGASGGAWRGSSSRAASSGRTTQRTPQGGKSAPRDEASGDDSGRGVATNNDEMTMGTWSGAESIAQQGDDSLLTPPDDEDVDEADAAAAGAGGAAGGPEESAAEDSVWYQDTYGAQWN